MIGSGVFAIQRHCGRGRLCALAALAILFPAPVRSSEIAGVFQEVNAHRDTLVLTVRGLERTFSLAPNVKVWGLLDAPLKDGLDSKLFKRSGVRVAVKTEKRGQDEIVTEIRVRRRGP